MSTNARVVDVLTGLGSQGEKARVVLEDGRAMEGDLMVGADGINSKLREIMLGHKDPAMPTCDLAYRLLLSTKEMMKDPKLRGFVEDPQVNYWLGPDAHAGLLPFLCLDYHLEGEKCADEISMLFSELRSHRRRAVQHGPPRTRRHAGRGNDVSWERRRDESTVQRLGPKAFAPSFLLSPFPLPTLAQPTMLTPYTPRIPKLLSLCEFVQK